MQHQKMLKPYLKVLAVCGLWWITSAFASASNPNVVVSIAPFHALVSAVMQDVGEPKLLVEKGASPHHYNLKPSEIKTLQEADLIFWGGPELETFLVKPLESLGPSTKTVELGKTDKLLLLPPRRSASFQRPKTHSQDAKHSKEIYGCCDHNHDQGPEAKDMHFWLDPNNAKLIVLNIVKQLSTIDKEHEQQYQQNARKFIKKLDAVDKRLKIQLKPIQTMPYMVFHDAYQYFEHHYHLKGVGAISIHPELPLSLQRLYEVRDTITQKKAICIFREPQFKAQLVENLAKETGVRVGELDPLGESHAKDGSDYFVLLENIADSLKGCLLQKSQ